MRGSASRTPASPRYPAFSFSPSAVLSPLANARPLLLLDRDKEVSNSAIVLQSPTGLLKKRNKDAPSRQLEGEDLDDGWTVVRSQHNITRAVLSAFNTTDASTERSSDVDGGIHNATRSPKWHDHDFPPLRLRQFNINKEGETRES